MKIKILAGAYFGGIEIVGNSVNGFDLSSFPSNGSFRTSEDMLSAGICNVEMIEGELIVSLIQQGGAYECQPVNGSHDWRGTGEWIDAADYDPAHCYIVATAAPEGAEYVKRDSGWTVVMPQPTEPLEEIS
jgi:hypothetical protein